MTTSLAACRTPDRTTTARPAGGQQVAEIDALDYRFSPRTIEFRPGSPLRVTVHNAGFLSHTFTTDSPIADVVVPPGEKRTVALDPVGPVTFFCRFHEPNGMKGALCAGPDECTPTLFP